LTAAVDSFGLVGPDDDIRQRSTVFENEHGLGLTRLILFGTYACCKASASCSLLKKTQLLTAAVIQLHPAIKRTRDHNRCVGSHSARRFWQNSRHTRRSSASASASGGGGAGHDSSRRCCGGCRLLRRCGHRATASGIVARTFCRQNFGLVITVRGPGRQSRRGCDDAFGEGCTEGRGCCCIGLDVACALVAVSVETAQGGRNESEEDEASVHGEGQFVVCLGSGRRYSTDYWGRATEQSAECSCTYVRLKSAL
jgi:hypothetical protein